MPKKKSKYIQFQVLQAINILLPSWIGYFLTHIQTFHYFLNLSPERSNEPPHIANRESVPVSII